MPTPPLLPSLTGLKALEQKAAHATSLIKSPSPSNFLNNVRTPAGDPGTQARNVVSGADQSNQAVQQVNNYSSNLKSIGAWGRQASNQVNASNLVKKAAKAAELNQARAARVSTSGPSRGGGAVAVSNPVMYSGPLSGSRSHLVKQAQSLLGTPYAWGGGGYGNRSSRGTGKGTQNVIGVDCSGLTSYVYGTLGIKIARQSDAQLRTAGVKTSINNLQPGDLVGWARGGHVAMYVGNGMIIESPKPGSSVRTRKLGSYDYSGGVYGVRVKLPGE